MDMPTIAILFTGVAFMITLSYGAYQFMQDTHS